MVRGRGSVVEVEDGVTTFVKKKRDRIEWSGV